MGAMLGERVVATRLAEAVSGRGSAQRSAAERSSSCSVTVESKTPKKGLTPWDPKGNVLYFRKYRPIGLLHVRVPCMEGRVPFSHPLNRMGRGSPALAEWTRRPKGSNGGWSPPRVLEYTPISVHIPQRRPFST